MQKKLVVLSGIVFTGALAINAGPVWSQAGGSSGGAPSGQKGGASSTETQKPTDPPAGTSRSKSSDSLGASSGQGRSGPSGAMQSDRAQGRSGAMGGQAGAGGMGGHGSREEVKQVQEALKDKGHDPGMVDGIMGPKTQQAIRAFQKKNNTQATGRLDEKTASALGVESSAAGAAGAGAGSKSGAGMGRESDSEKAKNMDKSSSEVQARASQARDPAQEWGPAQVRRAVLASQAQAPARDPVQARPAARANPVNNKSIVALRSD